MTRKAIVGNNGLNFWEISVVIRLWCGVGFATGYNSRNKDQGSKNIEFYPAFHILIFFKGIKDY